MGRILEGLTHSRFWNDMAVFITEDDPQDGQDHVDAHRTLQLVLSPYVKRGYVSSVHHSNMSALKTINLLLGVPPTSIQEASAASLVDHFQATPKLDPFTAVPTQVAPETNPPAAATANAQLRQAALLQQTIPNQLDRGGSTLQEILRLRHEGAVAAGNPNVPVLGTTVEHKLAQGDPTPVVLGPAKGSGAAACVAAVTQARPSGTRPAATGGRPHLVLAAVLVLAALVLRRSTRSTRATPRTSPIL
jgi:hypothetical protein